MSRETREFVINVMSEGLCIATKDFLLSYGYEPYLDMVPEIKIPKGRYEVVMEVFKTSRGNLRTSGTFDVKSPLVIGDFSHVIPDAKWGSFERDQNRNIMRGLIRECASVYTGREGDFDVVVSIKKV